MAPAAQALLAGFPRVGAWRARVEALGEGDRREVAAADALAIARDADPAPAGGVAAGEPNALAAGMDVTVTPDDYAFDPVRGTLLAASPEDVVIRRSDPVVGTVAVHFPRFGFRVLPAA
jgi:hypothetical protein